MVPELLPAALVVFVLMALLIVAIVRFYEIPRRGSALVVLREGQTPRVFTKGIAFVGFGNTKVATIDLAERTFLFPGVEVRLSPNESAHDLGAIVERVGADRANDPEAMQALLDPVVARALAAGDDESATDRVERAVEEAAPGFRVQVARA